jgi:hypothetical protein
MQPFTTDDSAHSHYSSQIRPALTSFADEVSATVARLFAYVGVLALFGILGVHAWDQLQLDWLEEPSLATGWSIAKRAAPDFVLSPQGIPDKPGSSETYLVLRHPAGGRKDVLRWLGPAGKPLAELEIYRPGAEYGSLTAARAELAGRIPAPDSRVQGAELESAGSIESKFGTVALLRRAGSSLGATPPCLGFLKRIDGPALQISGWSCRGGALATRRAGIDCMLSRIMPLGSPNEPKLAELFAHAELQPGSCASLSASADWISSADAPPLRGPL